jgi:hypothetical protein
VTVRRPRLSLEALEDRHVLSPVITSLSPNSAVVGSGGVGLTVNGSGFDPTFNYGIVWSVNAYPTEVGNAVFVSSNQLATIIPPGLVAGTAWVQARGSNGSYYELSSAVPFFVYPAVSSSSGPSVYGQSVSFTATVGAVAVGTPTGTVQFFIDGSPFGSSVPVSGGVAVSPAISSLSVGTHTISASYYNFGYLQSSGYLTGGQTVNPAPLTAMGINFAATAGAPFTGVVASFTNADPFGGPGSYTATITWGDGNTSAGTISDAGGGTYLVTGSNTYADPKQCSVQVLIQHKLGYTTPATAYATATVSSLGLPVQAGQTAGIGFWRNGNGQALIQSFNGGSNATALANWLALNFPNLYGSDAGSNNLFGKKNSDVATFYLGLFSEQGPKVDAEVLATALNVYASTQSLGGTTAQASGFTVSDTGLGARTFNVGADGAAFGVSNKAVVNVYQLLKAVNKYAVNGVLYKGNALLRSEASDLFDALNTAGGGS